MASELDYRYEELQRNVDLLLGMHDDVTQLRSRVAARLGDTAPGSWPDVPALQSFAGRRSTAVERLAAQIDVVADDVPRPETSVAPGTIS